MSKSFAFLSGLPRTGSTLLTSILSQNPDIHAEGTSALCGFMWDMHVSRLSEYTQKALAANGRPETGEQIVRALPEMYYANVQASKVIDKCRSWTIPANVDLIREYITPDPKIIVMTRPMQEIVDSFVRLRLKNGWTGEPEADLWQPDSEPITRPLAGVQYAQANNNGEFLFVEYADLVDDPSGVVDAIYEFVGWERFQHHFTGIVNPLPEDDSVWDFPGLHEVRPDIRRRVYA